MIVEHSTDPVGNLIAEVIKFVDQQPTGDIHISLTGGRSGDTITHTLIDQLRDNSRIHFWWSDERFVPTNDPERTAPTINSADYSCHFHAIPSSDESSSAQECAVTYSETLHKTLTSRFCSDNTLMDICILSVGPDGHIASLFPHHAALDSALGVVAISDSPKPPSQRVTWTFHTINASRQVWLLATGDEKRAAVAAIQAQADFHDIPAAGATGKTSTRLFTDIAN